MEVAAISAVFGLCYVIPLSFIPFLSAILKVPSFVLLLLSKE